MSDEPDRRHNGGPLSEDDARKLWNHVRAIENLEEAAQEIRDDVSERKKLAKADGFDTNILAAIVKRRKIGAGETRAADSLVRLYEEALEEQKILPLEETKQEPRERRTLDEIDADLHGPDPDRMLN
jgi:uncharacterized protein (UPF0335 family)